MSDDRKSLGQLLTDAIEEFGIHSNRGVINLACDVETVTLTVYRLDADGRRFLTESGEPATATHVQGTHFLAPHVCGPDCSHNGPAA